MKSDVLKIIVNDNLEDMIDLIYFLDNKTEFIKNNKSDNSINENDSILSTLNDCSITVMKVKRSSD